VTADICPRLLLTTADVAAENGFTAYLVRPSDGLLQTSAAFVDGAATLHVDNPGPGLWEIDVKLNLTTSARSSTRS